jgi:hypothetical protein
MIMSWRKSTYSSNNGGDCVEVGTWRKSSYSNVGGECVEAAAISATVAVRDTKDHGPVLRFTSAAWTAFTTTLR